MGGYGVAVFAHRRSGRPRLLRNVVVRRRRRRLYDARRGLPARLAFVSGALHFSYKRLRGILHLADYLPGAARHLRQLVRSEDDQCRRSDDEHVSR